MFHIIIKKLQKSEDFSLRLFKQLNGKKRKVIERKEPNSTAESERRE